MWWILFTAVDIYIGLIILDTMVRSGSIPSHKLERLSVVKKVVVVLLIVSGLAFVVALFRRVAG